MADPLRPWTIVSSRYVISDQWIALRADSCRTSTGEVVEPFYVLEFPDWVHVVAVDAEDRLLLVEQYRHGMGTLSLEVPAGRIEPGEAPEAAAMRELMEETGCAGAIVAALPPLSPNPASHANRIHTVVMRDVRLVQAPKEDPAEVIRSRWTSIEEALELVRSGALAASPQLASLYLGLQALDLVSIGPTRT